MELEKINAEIRMLTEVILALSKKIDALIRGGH